MSTNHTQFLARKEELRSVLLKYGLELDLETLMTTSLLRSTDDIPWMSAEEMSDPRLTGTFEQYVAMQSDSKRKVIHVLLNDSTAGLA